MGLCNDLLFLQPRMLHSTLGALSFRHKDHIVLHAALNWPDEVLGICGGADRSKDDHLSGEHESTNGGSNGGSEGSGGPFNLPSIISSFASQVTAKP